MLKLFLSLYIVIASSILAINFFGDYVYSRYFFNKTEEFYNIRLVINSFKNNVAESKDLVGIKTYALDELQLNEEEHQSFVNGKELFTFDSEGNTYVLFFIPNINRAGQVGPFIFSEDNIQEHIIFKLVAYSALWLIISIWLLPIWRDLMRQKEQLQSLANGKLITAEPPVRFSAITDVTEQINKISSRLSELIESQRLLVNSVSHELRTPLARIKFSLSFLPEDQKETKDSIHEDLDELDDMVEEMLSYARLESESYSYAKSKVDVYALLVGLVEKVGKVCDLKIELQGSRESFINGNKKYLDRCFQNLILNADKYANGHLKISIAKVGQQLILSFEDNGPGIPQTLQEKIFEPFNRGLHEGASKGYGLGLAIVRKVAVFHGGQCNLDGNYNEGARFIITLPRYKDN